MGMTGTYGFVNAGLTRKDALRSTLAVPGDGADHRFPLDAMVSPFRRASLVLHAAFSPGYGSGPANMAVSLEASLDGTNWLVMTIHDRLAVPPDPLTNPPDAIVGDQHIQAEAILVDADLQAEVADVINHFPYYRLVCNSPTVPCTITAWLHASG